MGTLKTQPEKRIINGVEKLVSTKVITSEPEYIYELAEEGWEEMV